MNLSIRAYSRHRGCSDTAVRKAIKTGRITQESDGKINPNQADAQWISNTDNSKHRKKMVEVKQQPEKKLVKHFTTTLKKERGTLAQRLFFVSVGSSPILEFK